jgi:flagellar assembly protein FliH
MPLADRKVKKLKELTDDEMELVNWHLPDVEDEFKSNEGKTTAMGKPLDWYYDKAQRELEPSEEPEEELRPLTAEEIEEIRQAAYEEGILQGHNDGFEKGHLEGQEKGYIDGMEKGREEGFQSGMAEGKENIDQLCERWKNLVHLLNNPLLELEIKAEQQLVELAVQLAEAVVGVEVKTNPQIIFQTLKDSVEALPIADTTCEIKLSQQDFELVKKQFTEEELADKGWHIGVDPTIEQGGCVVESRTSSIDRTLATRIKNTLDRFLQDTGIREAEQD